MADAGLAPARLRITEIFRSLQGEADSVGWPTVFVRLTGCPLRCGYCDTSYAFHGGERHTLDRIIEQVCAFETRRVCVTGGEPLAQPEVHALMSRLCDLGHLVSIETSGALDISGIDPRVIRVVDVKTPGSGEVHRNRWQNLDDLRPADQLKFVLCDRVDYDWAVACIGERGLSGRCDLLFSPCHERLAPGQLADWILADSLPVRFQFQLHKLLWGDVPGR
jgi:Organic radical activating enzymes